LLLRLHGCHSCYVSQKKLSVSNESSRECEIGAVVEDGGKGQGLRTRHWRLTAFFGGKVILIITSHASVLIVTKVML
jgi:hypothetical protein